MQVQFERTGGVAGIRTGATINVESLSPEDAQHLYELIDVASFFELPAEIIGPSQGADSFLYTLTVEMEGRRHTVRTSEASVPSVLRPLIAWLTNGARRARRVGGTP